MIRRAERDRSALSAREFIRGELRLGVVGGGGEAGESPIERGPGIDAEELAGAEDGVDDGGAIAGIRMADKQPIFATELGRANRKRRLGCLGLMS